MHRQCCAWRVSVPISARPKWSSRPSACRSFTARPLVFTCTTIMDARILVVCAAMAAAAGLVGCFAVMRRMTLAADAFSHVALPGIGLALALKLDPLFGALAALLVGSVIIWG